MSDIGQFRADFTAVYAHWRDTGEPDVGAREKSAAAAAVQAHMHNDDWMRGAAATFRRIREDQERDIARRERIKAEVRAERAQQRKAV